MGETNVATTNWRLDSRLIGGPRKTDDRAAFDQQSPDTHFPPQLKVDCQSLLYKSLSPFATNIASLLKKKLPSIQTTMFHLPIKPT